MGIEYKVNLKQPAQALIDRTLRDCTFFDDYDRTYDLYNFRWDGSDHSQMPNVSTAIEPDGLYICFHGGDKQMFEKFVEYIRTLVVDRLDQQFNMGEI